jgi:antagonist of KipI
MRGLQVLRAGFCSTIQDLGRERHRRMGVGVGGAMDRISHQTANALVGNELGAATQEMTLFGDELLCNSDHVIAVTGADMQPRLRLPDGLEVDLPQKRPVSVRAGSILKFSNAVKGCRSYLGIAGGFDVPMVLGSRATFLRASLGGYLGRRIQKGDILPIGSICRGASIAIRFRLSTFDTEIGNGIPNSSGWAANWSADLFGQEFDARLIRVTEGEQLPLLSLESRTVLEQSGFEVSNQSDRMGLRLTGQALHCIRNDEIASTGVTVGTIQLPTDGYPIILMVDGAPTGGYPQIAHVITADLPRLAQLKPGDRMNFQFVSIEAAHQAIRTQQQEFERMLQGIRLWYQ